MFKNYFYLRRAISELNPILSGANIIDIYSQEKNILFISIPCDEYPNRHLLISANPQSPFLIIKKVHNKAKRNVVNVFNDILPVKIRTISIAEDDRIINIDLGDSNLFLKVMGNKTNIYLKSKNEKLESFKKTEELKIKDLDKCDFANDINIESLNSNNDVYVNISDLKKRYPMISSEIRNEIILRSDNVANVNIFKVFSDIVKEILTDKICVGFSDELNKTMFLPQGFQLAKILNNSKLFADFNNALQFYISSNHKSINKSDLTKELSTYFDKELTTLSNKLNKLSSRIEEGSKEKLYSNYGSILLSNIYALKKGMHEILLNDFTGQPIIIKLDTKLNAKQNIDRYFEKSRDEKVNYKKSTELFILTKEKYDYLLKEKDVFSQLEKIEDIETFYKRIIPKKEKIIKMDTGLKFKYWHYIIDELYNVYVGRDSKSNDYLSIKFAKQNDYWFHARGLPGSHVVLRVENVKEGVPKPIIKKAASLAAYHSKAKTAGTAPVSYTFAKFVYKKKGMPPGKVILTKENTLLVKPEIPKNCELINE